MLKKRLDKTSTKLTVQQLKLVVEKCAQISSRIRPRRPEREHKLETHFRFDVSEVMRERQHGQQDVNGGPSQVGGVDVSFELGQLPRKGQHSVVKSGMLPFFT